MKNKTGRYGLNGNPGDGMLFQEYKIYGHNEAGAGGKMIPLEGYSFKKGERKSHKND